VIDHLSVTLGILTDVGAPLLFLYLKGKWLLRAAIASLLTVVLLSFLPSFMLLS